MQNDWDGIRIRLQQLRAAPELTTHTHTWTGISWMDARRYMLKSSENMLASYYGVNMMEMRQRH